MFGESQDNQILGFDAFMEAIEFAAWEVFNELNENEDINEGVDSPSSPVNKALKNKSDKTRFPLGILNKYGKEDMLLGKKDIFPEQPLNSGQWQELIHL